MILITTGNGNAQQQCKKLTLLSIENYFEEIIISSDAGFSKPDVRIFEAAFEKSGISAKDCVYIGDRLETDAIAASNAGMRGVWLNRGNYQNSKEIEIISSLSEVSNLIGK